jgi:hypothetical protein
MLFFLLILLTSLIVESENHIREGVCWPGTRAAQYPFTVTDGCCWSLSWQSLYITPQFLTGRFRRQIPTQCHTSDHSPSLLALYTSKMYKPLTKGRFTQRHGLAEGSSTSNPYKNAGSILCLSFSYQSLLKAFTPPG